MGYMETYKEWCDNQYFSEEARAELKAIAGNEAEIEDRFYKNLKFGTGGMRGNKRRKGAASCFTAKTVTC